MLILLLTCLTCLTSLQAQNRPRQNPAARRDKRPNILFILTDDQAPWALGLSGHPHMLTPHLDDLFQSGAYLHNCFTPTPVCSPARTSIMTGRYGTEMGITDWIRPGQEDELGLATGTPVWPKYLQDAGYQTALVGKWHLGTQPHQHPTKFGFDYFMGLLDGGASPRNPKLEVNGQVQVVQGFTVDIVTDEALRWMRLTDPKQPFCLCVHYREPHAAYVPVRDEDMEPFETLDPQIPNPDYPKLDIPLVKKKTREYLACMHGVDRCVGNILGELERIHADKNTIVIYSSDHGYNMGHNGIWHKGNGHWILTEPPPGTDNVPKGQRPNMYDLSLRVPTAIRWPGVIKPGTIVDQTVCHLDWFPTILEMAGVQTPADLSLRGRSIVPVLKGQGGDWNNDLYAQYSTHHQSQTHMRTYRTPEWKLIRDFLNPERDELYNLTDDPKETTNLIAADDPALKQVIASLHDKILERMEATDDPVLETARARK
ncbi:MAG: sulfatase [Planctomycetaceae bacterium]